MNIPSKHNHKTPSTQLNLPLFVITFSIVLILTLQQVYDTLVLGAEVATSKSAEPVSQEPFVGASVDECRIFRNVGRNDLSITDIVVESAITKVACLKARFLLAIKVEVHEQNQSNQSDIPVSYTDQINFLGYLPLDSLKNVENTCPDTIPTTKNQPKQVEPIGPTNTTGDVLNDELKMIVSYECGNLTFTFRKDSESTLLTLEGLIKLDNQDLKCLFTSEEPVVFSWDPTKHFKHNDLIEIKSSGCSEYILTANFYNFEVETFRNTKNRDFIRPPDENSMASYSKDSRQQVEVGK